MYVIRKEQKVLEALQKIFGNIVVKGYICTYSYGFELEDEDKINDLLDEAVLKLDENQWFLEKDKSLDLPYPDICAEFNNGIKVVFSNTCYGGQLDRLNGSDYVEIEESL